MIRTAKIILVSNKLFFSNPYYYFHYNFEPNYYYCIQIFKHIFQISVNKSTDWNYNTQYFSFKNSPKCALFSERQTLETPVAPTTPAAPHSFGRLAWLDRARMCARARNWGSCTCLIQSLSTIKTHRNLIEFRNVQLGKTDFQVAILENSTNNKSITTQHKRLPRIIFINDWQWRYSPNKKQHPHPHTLLWHIKNSIKMAVSLYARVSFTKVTPPLSTRV